MPWYTPGDNKAPGCCGALEIPSKDASALSHPLLTCTRTIFYPNKRLYSVKTAHLLRMRVKRSHPSVHPLHRIVRVDFPHGVASQFTWILGLVNPPATILREYTKLLVSIQFQVSLTENTSGDIAPLLGRTGDISTTSALFDYNGPQCLTVR